jgi:hypothetical protein
MTLCYHFVWMHILPFQLSSVLSLSTSNTIHSNSKRIPFWHLLLLDVEMILTAEWMELTYLNKIDFIHVTNSLSCRFSITISLPFVDLLCLKSRISMYHLNENEFSRKEDILFVFLLGTHIIANFDIRSCGCIDEWGLSSQREWILACVFEKETWMDFSKTGSLCIAGSLNKESSIFTLLRP